MEETTQKTENIKLRIIEEEMKKSYLSYSMSVIVGRALPDVRDGLKPVHRRILFSMNENGMFHNKPFKKSARIVGDTLGKYHPHGDMAVYDSLVRMAQDFSLRCLPIQGQGNFGSIDGDPPASMRYTEARLTRLSEEMLQDIEKETVKFTPNFDASLQEPTVLPSKLPNLLINGSSGIAVGMATNIPPHNLNEISEGIIAQIDNPEMSIAELMQYVKGPDFPTGAIICNRNELISAYSTGRGKISVRAKTTLEQEKRRIIVTEIPYMVNKAQLLEQIASLVRDKRIHGISDLRDESDREGLRMVIELRQDANPQIVLNQLFANSRLQVTFGVIMLALVNNEPKILNLKQLIQCYIDHRKEIVTKRTQFDLTKAQKRSHILKGIIIALDNIDPVIKLIKESKAVEQAKQALTSNYSLTEEQAVAILDMKLQRLTSLEQGKIKEEQQNLLVLIEDLKSILASEQKILDIIKKELQELKEKYGDSRKTELTQLEMTEFSMEDIIKPEDMVITVTHSGYIKRQPIATYRSQHRGGKGIIATQTREEDFVKDIFIANTHSYILFFTNKGRAYWLKVYNIPEASRTAQGKAVINLLKLENDEQITTHIPVKRFDGSNFLVMVTKKGVIKKTDLINFQNPRSTGIIACDLREGDELIGVELTDGNQQIILATKNGLAVRFKEQAVRSMGRTATGVRGITLKDNDEVVGAVKADDQKTLLTITENGFGKGTAVSEYRLTNRGGIGVRNIICSERNGKVVSIIPIVENDELIFISKNGIVLRTKAKEISVIGRATQGSRIMRLAENDKLVSVAKLIRENS